MALTRDFKETVAARVQNDPAFAQALLDEAITLFVNGEPESAKLILRDLVNATVGFEALADELHKPAKSLHRMLSKSGNPTMPSSTSCVATFPARRPFSWTGRRSLPTACTGARSPTLRATTCRVSRPRRRPSMTPSDSIATSPGCDWSRSAWALAGCAIDWRVSPREPSQPRPLARELGRRFCAG